MESSGTDQTVTTVSEFEEETLPECLNPRQGSVALSSCSEEDPHPKEVIEVPPRENFPEFLKSERARQFPNMRDIKQSYDIGRDTNSLSIVLTGLSGAGISNLTNNLLGQEVTGQEDSSTEIIRYTVKWPFESIGVTNTKIHFYDIPGFFNYENNLEFDTKVLGKIRGIFKKIQVFPNFFIIVLNINEKRLELKKGPFVKMLEAFRNHLKEEVIDEKHPNVIIVLTHLCGALPAVQSDPSAAVETVEELAKQYLQLPKVLVVVGENRVEDYSLVKIEDHYVLPDGRLFPQNVYQAMTRLAESQDPIGSGIANEICIHFGILSRFDVTTKVLTSKDFAPGIYIPPVLYDIPARQFFQQYVHMPQACPRLDPMKMSYDLRRSPNSVSILMLGLTESGKSHTINSLFNQTLAEVHAAGPGTYNIIEYSVETQTQTLLMNNSRVHIIDTPGFGDPTSGIEVDSKIYANIRDYFERQTYYPNIILLVSRITDLTDAKKSELFMKQLKAIRSELSGIVLDTEHPNLIVVLTHLCSLPPRSARDPREKVAYIKNIVAETLNLPDVPVEPAENLCADYRLQKIGENYQLPNKQLFPRNIFVRMGLLCKASNDHVGYGIINESIQKFPTFAPHTMSFSVKDISGFSTEAIRLLSYRRAASTEIMARLYKCWDKMSLKDKLTCRLQADEIGAKLLLLGLRTNQDLPKNVKETMNLLRLLSPDPGMEKFLKTALRLTAPAFQFDLLLGRAFDVIRDSVTDFTILELGDMVFNEIGCTLPAHVRATCSHRGTLTWNYAPLKKDLEEKRLLTLNLERGPRSSVIEYENRPGYNLPTNEKLSVVYDYHLFQLDVKETAPLNPAFETIIRNLPKSYDGRNEDNRSRWQDFLAIVGSHFVRTSYVGGSLIFELSEPGEATIANLNSSQMTPAGFFTCLMDLKALRPGTSQEDGAWFEVTVVGGDKGKGEGLLKSENIDEFNRRMKDWEDSIWDNPVVTDSFIGLGEVADVVSHLDPVRAAALRAAVCDLHNIKLKRRRNCVIS